MQYDGAGNYNGNINSTNALYRTALLQNSANCANFTPQNAYTYTYDGLNRLTKA
jgi:hypothetical protein